MTSPEKICQKVRVAGSAETGYDPANFYLPDTVVIGSLVWGDLEFNQTNAVAGRKSFVTKIVSQQITKIINIAPLLNEEEIGVCGQLYSLALGSVDNTRRFEVDPDRLAVAVPEICALPLLGENRVVLNITDALIGQYEGSGRGLLDYSAVVKLEALVQPRSGGARHAGHSGTGQRTARRRCPANKAPVGALCQRQSASTG